MKLNFLTIPSNKSYTLDKSFTDTTSIIDFKKYRRFFEIKY